MGFYALLTGHDEQAVAEFTNLIKTMDPVTPAIYYHLARAHAKLSVLLNNSQLHVNNNQHLELTLSYLTQYI